MPFSWDAKSLRYRGEGGRFVKKEAVTRAIDSAVDEAARRVKSLSERLQRAEISLPEWTLGMRDILKAEHVLMAGIANGGKAQLSPAVLGRVGQITRLQYEKLAAFGRQIQAGLPLGKSFLNRASLYAEAGRSTFVEAKRRRAIDAGHDEEINVLNAKESCPSCTAETSKGWVRIGTLSRVGTRQCLVRCRCEIVTRRAA